MCAEGYCGLLEEKRMLRLLRRQRLYETYQLMKDKISEEYEVLEEVFDKPTIFTIFNLLRSGILKKLGGVISSGKESRVYWGLSLNGKELAVKIFLTTSSEFKRSMPKYIVGDPRFTAIKRTTRGLVYLWASKEFKNLKRAYEGGVRVPKPIVVRKNVLVMDFIGEHGKPAPLMKDVKLENPKNTYLELLMNVKTLLDRSQLIHGDLSQYNVMIWRGEPILFDMSQSVLNTHPLAMDLLRRDVENINAYFKKLGVKIRPAKEVIEWVLKGG
jgi:RIO kinase 1